MRGFWAFRFNDEAHASEGVVQRRWIGRFGMTIVSLGIPLGIPSGSFAGVPSVTGLFAAMAAAGFGGLVLLTNPWIFQPFASRF